LIGRDEGIERLSFPLPIIVEGGGVVGAFALVTVIPIGTPLILLLDFFLKIILRWVGLVIFKKY
jgi:hypothetical protein